VRRYKPHILYQNAYKKVSSRRGKAYAGLILSFLTASFFAVFALRPTVLTIISLRRQVTDFQKVDRELQEKIDALSRLSFTYRSLEPDLVVIETAVPTQTNLSTLVQNLAEVGDNFGVTLNGFVVSDLRLTSTDISEMGKRKMIKPRLDPVKFTVTYTGPYEGLLDVLEGLNKLNRLIVIDKFSLTAEGIKKKTTTLQVEARAFSIIVK
jgi:Tfp pilus assembly protein PilO